VESDVASEMIQDVRRLLARSLRGRGAGRGVAHGAHSGTARTEASKLSR
jgi:hypothetical protein